MNRTLPYCPGRKTFPAFGKIPAMRIAPVGAGDPWWRDAVPTFRRDGGFRFEAPVADMAVHLPWLAARLEALGGSVEIDPFSQNDRVEMV